MTRESAYDKALSVEVFDGEVVLRSLDGPMGVSLTPRAAAETASELAKAAELAAEHQASQTSSVRD